MTEWSVEVETESAGRYEDVDLETLHRLVSQLNPDNSYLIVHRSDKRDEFAQAAIQRKRDATLVVGSFIVEFKDETGEQVQATTKDSDRVRDALAGWAFDLMGWKEHLKWKPLKLNQVINLRGNCEVSESGGVWTVRFPFLDLTVTGATEDEASAELRTVIAETVNRDPEKREMWAKWASENVIEVSPQELERITSSKLSPEQLERLQRSNAEFLRNRAPRQKKRASRQTGARR